MLWGVYLFFFFKQKTAYEMRISDWSSDVCSSDLRPAFELADIPLRLKNIDMEVEQHAGFDGLPELHPVDAHEIDELARAAEAERFDRQYAARLRQRLDDEAAGHDRPAGEQVGRATGRERVCREG